MARRDAGAPESGAHTAPARAAAAASSRLPVLWVGPMVSKGCCAVVLGGQPDEVSWAYRSWHPGWPGNNVVRVRARAGRPAGVRYAFVDGNGHTPHRR